MGAFSYQDNNYSCGIHAIMNSLVALGENSVTYDEIKALAGTTSRQGTSRSGIVRCLEQLGFRATVYKTRDEDNAWRWLYRWSDTTPVIVLLDKYTHWASVNGRIDNRVILVDPYPKFYRQQNGVYPYSKEEMLARWKHKMCLAIRVSR